MEERRTERIERWLTRRNAWTAIVLIILVSLLSGWALRDVRVDYDFEKFFPNNDPELDRYLAFRERFGHDNDFLLLGIEGNGHLFDRGLLTRVDSLSAKLQRIPRVLDVVSPTRMKEPLITPLGAFERPWLRLDNDTVLAIDSARLMSDKRMREFFFSKDGRSMLVALNAEPNLSKLKCDTLLAQVHEAMRSAGLENARMAGRIVGQDHYISTMISETLFFMATSIVMLMFFLWLAFRSGYGVWVPLTVVGLSIVWQIALMTALGRPLGILTIMLPTILFVVGMSDVVHILECYLEEIRRGTARVRAIAITYSEVGLPTFLTALTSGIGFATLGTASIPPMQEFGLFTAIGVLLAFCLAFTLLPALLVLVEPARLLPTTAGASPWDTHLPDWLRWTIRRRRWILAGFVVIGLVGSWGASRLRVNNYLLEDLSDSDPFKKGFLWFEDHFGGVRPFEMEVEIGKGHNAWDYAVLKEIEEVQTYIDTAYDVDAIVSPASVMHALNKSFHAGDASFDRLPDDEFECERMAKRAKLIGKQLLATVVNEDGTRARISGRQEDEGGAVHNVKNALLLEHITAHTDTSVVRFHLTGMAHLIDRNNATLSGQLLQGMALAVLLTALIMLWFFRDWRMVIVALVPNLVPLVFIACVMGLTGIDLKVSTAIIFSIAFGIAEDDTIHMLAALRQHMREGRSPAYALKRTYLRTGKAVTVTSLMLLSGFMALIFSDFASIHYMGLLITCTLAFAFVAELLLLPALVMLLMRKKGP